MFQIIKFCGITVEQVAALDKVLDSEAVLTEGRYWWSFPTVNGRYPFVEKVRVVSDGPSYLYTIRINSQAVLYRDVGTREDSMISDSKVTLQCPRRIITAIYDAAGLYPKDETPIPAVELTV